MLIGRPGRIMPAFQGILGDAQMQEIIRYLRARSATISPAEQLLSIDGDVIAGKAVYVARCVECHGAEGKSIISGIGVEINTGAEPEVVPVAIDNIGFQQAASDAMLYHIIMQGRADSPSHAFANFGLTPSVAEDLIAYIRTFGNQAEPSDASDLPKPPLSYTVESPYDFQTTLENIKMAVSSNNFRVFPDRYLEQGLIDDSEVNQKQVIIRFCNFSNLYELLKIDPRVGAAVPCQITLLQTAKGVFLSSLNPIAMAAMFNNEALTKFAKQVDENIRWVMEEATL